MAAHHIGRGHSVVLHLAERILGRIRLTHHAGSNHYILCAENLRHICTVDKLADIVVCRICAHILRRAHLDQAAVTHNRHSISQFKRLVDIMCYKHHRLFQLPLQGQ